MGRVIDGIFEHEELNGYTFFAHNLGRFDAVFLIKGIVLGMTIKHIESKRKIKLLDSMQFVKGSLRDILISFNCNVNKGFFPYTFVNIDNLQYIGNKPDFKYFDNITSADYEQVPQLCDIKAETFKYLYSDIKGLLEFITKFSDMTFKEYSLNITKLFTVPALAMGIFTSGYYDESKNKIKVIKVGPGLPPFRGGSLAAPPQASRRLH